MLFKQGGATGQFAAVPLNLSVNGKADYFITGVFASGEASVTARARLSCALIVQQFSLV